MLPKQTKILIIDDDTDVLLAAKLFLKQHVALIHTETNPESIPTLLKNESYDVILLDMNFTRDVSSGSEGFYWLNKILQTDPGAVVILITAYGDVEMAVRAIKEGAIDFVVKPWQNEKLLATLSSAMNLRRSRLEIMHLRDRQQALNEDLDHPFGEIIGHSSSMQAVFALIQKVAKTEANVLILGENGTGKELVARALHRESLRAKESFITVDMGVISETLFESELFGHVKGAFTDAKEDRAGRFEIASGGTLFLDEIGNLSVSLQAKLLNALQERRITRVGSNKSVDVDIRLISATNMPIHNMANQKTFRQDLLYRINTVEIPLPPLRERTEDIPLLAEHFLSVYSKKYQRTAGRFHPHAIKKLERYNWPGNVRELQHTIERAMIMSDAECLEADDFLLTSAPVKNEGLVIDDYNLEEIEKALIRKALSKHGGNISQAAKELGLTRTSLYRRLEKYGL
ncbi:sigma-54-dependent Fis family transcriptional regulator [bacterium]|nr:MAG: sigma-54-dependent Fis family transcriptional regulator [bacterium]